jgi:hypothetical protein
MPFHAPPTMRLIYTDSRPERKIHLRTTLTVLGILSFSTMLMASESFYGTWKLNLAKSDLKCTNDASVTMTITETGPNSYRNVSRQFQSLARVNAEEAVTAILTAKNTRLPDNPG